ncbi:MULTISPECIES: LysR substrate-binding domain-containing protein [unclassified Pseudomonas]|uniref:LysR family transcriptional regulator n=1 Tax=unclassified Pseudomonas TaxID=196821 RepID=UPI0002A2F8D9|nr:MULTISPECIES: LysR substrate-binding domain-containing protein [unclassified Pseudomonas]MBB1605005.1 LysR family transcriptional regulator [Pseudomonas sp. UMC76]MBB1640416.1 LysR family transcriptional regulator [Pseudomonas sp. UME83]NTX88463.1 LysR family transcriptional regulator [Pseudomonas sp. UMA643]NTY19815.1 LysR family transcriptional regulator [Pseudomonas sp. UMC3103]NTY26440.1 LysR family transcriptional regulator [Pseudomonas sp. UMA603]
MDRFSSLALFVACAETGSFSRAAEQLGKTPSAVTKAIGQLEASLGARLFERTTRSMALTEAGQLYLDSAREVLARMHETAEEIGQLQHSLRGSLRITAPLAFGAAFLNDVCADFLNQHPQLRLQVDLSDSYVDLLDGRYDLALRLGHSNLPGLIVRPLVENRLVLCASPEYLARRGEPRHPLELAEHDRLTYWHPALDTRWWLERDGERFSILREGRLSSDNHELLLAACLKGRGLMPCPLWSVQPYLRDGRLRSVLEDYHFDPDAFGQRILAVYPSHRRATRKILAFIEHLEEALRQLGIEA